MAAGAEERWYDADYSVNEWQSIDVPHTWQADPATRTIAGVAWYRRSFDVPRCLAAFPIAASKLGQLELYRYLHLDITNLVRSVKLLTLSGLAFTSTSEYGVQQFHL